MLEGREGLEYKGLLLGSQSRGGREEKVSITRASKD